MIFGIFFGMFTLIWLGARTFIPWLTLVRWLVLLCVVGNLVPYVSSGLRFGMARLEWFFFNLLAIGPTITSLLIIVNHFVHGPVTSRTQQLGEDFAITVNGPDGPGSFTVSRSMFGFTREEIASSTGVYRVGIAKGCLGYWSVVECEVITR